jgi:hypothetical protein
MFGMIARRCGVMFPRPRSTRGVTCLLKGQKGLAHVESMMASSSTGCRRCDTVGPLSPPQVRDLHEFEFRLDMNTFGGIR